MTAQGATHVNWEDWLDGDAEFIDQEAIVMKRCKNHTRHKGNTPVNTILKHREKVGGCAIVGFCGCAIIIWVVLLFLEGGVIAIIGSCLVTICCIISGMFAIWYWRSHGLVSRLKGPLALEEIALPDDETVRFSWRKFKLYPEFEHGKLWRILNVKPETNIWYAFSFENVKMKAIVEKGGLNAKEMLRYEHRTPEQRHSSLLAHDGAWKVNISAGISGEHNKDIPKILQKTVEHALEASFIGTDFKKTTRKTYGYFYGDEVYPALYVPKELAPSIPVGTPVEAHTPASMILDIEMGELIEAESWRKIGAAGILLSQMDNGMCIAGGIPMERIALLKTTLSQLITSDNHNSNLPIILFDDHGDFGMDREQRFHFGARAMVNPLLPPNGMGARPDEIFYHVELLVTILTMMSGWRVEQSAFAAKLMHGYVQACIQKHMIPTVGTMLDEISFDVKSTLEHGVQVVLERLFTGENARLFSMQDKPQLSSSMLCQQNKPVVMDTRMVHGPAKRFLKLVLLLKVQQALTPAKIPTAVIIPELDKLFHEEDKFSLSNKYTRQSSKLFNQFSQDKVYHLFSCQHVSWIPQTVLQRVGILVALGQSRKKDVDVLSILLGLEDEQLFDRSRHSSYQKRFLYEMKDGIAYMKRPDFSSSFLIQLDIARGLKLLNQAAPVAIDDSLLRKQRAASLLDDIMREFAAIKPAILRILENMRVISQHGIKKRDLVDLWTVALHDAVVEANPGLSKSNTNKRVRYFAGRLFERLVLKGILIESDYSDTGLEGDVLVKLSEFGNELLQRNVDDEGEIQDLEKGKEYQGIKNEEMQQQINDAFIAMEGYLQNRDMLGLGKCLMVETETIIHYIITTNPPADLQEILIETTSTLELLASALDSKNAPSENLLYEAIQNYRHLVERSLA